MSTLPKTCRACGTDNEASPKPDNQLLPENTHAFYECSECGAWYGTATTSNDARYDFLHTPAEVQKMKDYPKT